MIRSTAKNKSPTVGRTTDTAVRPRVSIGLFVRNGKDYIEETLQSLLEQTYGDFELVIVDNASTDTTRDICSTFSESDHRIRYFRNRENIGAARNANLAFSHGKGEYFKWSSHDDLCAPGYIEQCVTALDNNTDAVMCYPKTTLIGPDGKSLNDEHLRKYQDFFDLRSTQVHIRFREFLRVGIFCHPIFGLIRRSALEKTRLFGSFPLTDKVLLGELAVQGKCMELPDRLAFRRLHPRTSHGVNKSFRSVARWVDPTAKATGILGGPRRRLLVEYVRLLRRARLSTREQLACYAELALFGARYAFGLSPSGRARQRVGRGWVSSGRLELPLERRNPLE